MIRKLVLSLALVSGVLLAAPAAEARDGCGPGFHRGFYGWCRPNWRPYAYRAYFYGPGYRRFGYHRGGGYRWHYRYHYAWHRNWHRGFGWHRGGFRHAGWHRHFRGDWRGRRHHRAPAAGFGMRPYAGRTTTFVLTGVRA